MPPNIYLQLPNNDLYHHSYLDLPTLSIIKPPAGAKLVALMMVESQLLFPSQRTRGLLPQLQR